jgi:O-antigen ligase
VNFLSPPRMERSAAVIVILLGCAIPISTALSSLLLAAYLLIFILSSNFHQKLEQIRKLGPALAALALFSWMVLATTYGPASLDEAKRYLVKYLDLAFIALLAPAFVNRRIRQFGLLTMGAVMVVTLLLSLLGAVGVIDGKAENAALVFKGQITQNLLLAYFGFALLATADAVQNPRSRLLLRLIAGIAFADVLFLGQGRTGYAVVAALTLFYLSWHWRWRGVGIFLVVLGLVASLAIASSSSIGQRIGLALDELHRWQPSHTDPNSSTGLRLDFYKNSLEIISEQPIFGVGTGGMIKTYRHHIEGTDKLFTMNPHNEYLLVTLQQGLVGLVLLLAIFLTQWGHADRLKSPTEAMLMRGLVVTMVIGCLFNSLLLDHTEGLAYAWMTALLLGGTRDLQERVS